MSASKTTHVKYFTEIFAIVNNGCPLKRVWNHLGNKALGRSVRVFWHWVSWSGKACPKYRRASSMGWHSRVDKRKNVSRTQEFTSLASRPCIPSHSPQGLPPGLPTTAWWTDPQTVSQTNLSSFMLSLSWQLDKRPLEHLEVFLWSLFSWLSLGQSIMATVDFHSVGFSHSIFLNRDASRQHSPGQILTTSQWWKSPPLPLPLHLRYLQSNLWHSHTWKK